jgi:hypothetical protein
MRTSLSAPVRRVAAVVAVGIGVAGPFTASAAAPSTLGSVAAVKAVAGDLLDVHLGAAPTAFRSYLDSHHDAIGGYYQDPATGDVTVLIAKDAAVHRTALQALDGGLGTHLHFGSAALTMAQVDADAQRVKDDLEVLNAQGLQTSIVYPDYQRNQVSIGLTRVDSGIVAQLTSRYRDVPLHIFQKPRAEPTGGYVTDAPPFKGGQFISTPDTTKPGYEWECTSAFIVSQYVNGQYIYFMATAGHCISGAVPPGGSSTNETWSQGYQGSGVVIGAPYTAQYNSIQQNDAALIGPLTAAHVNATVFDHQYSCGFLGFQTCDVNWRMYNEATTSWVGEDTCLSGTHTGNVVCSTITAVNATVTETSGVTLNHMDLAKYTALPGDSGGAWFREGTSEAEGIQSGSYSNNGGSVYTEIYEALFRLGGSGTYNVASCSQVSC